MKSQGVGSFVCLSKLRWVGTGKIDTIFLQMFCKTKYNGEIFNTLLTLLQVVFSEYEKEWVLCYQTF